MTAPGKAGKIVCTFVNLLHEWRFGIDVRVLLEDSMDFCNDNVRIEHVLEHRLNPDSVKGLRLKRQFMRIAKEDRGRRCVNVRTDQLYIGIAVELVGTEADHATANDQDSGILSLRLDQ